MFTNQKEFDINMNTTLNNDCCEKESRIRNNRHMHDYNKQHVECSTTVNNDNYMRSLEKVGVFQGNARDGSGAFINGDSDLKNGKFGYILTSQKSKCSKNLDTSKYLNSPFLGSGETVLKNPDLKSRLLSGEDTHMDKSCDTLSGVSIDRFTPLVPCLKENVQDTKHIIPQYWVRGGMSTRNIIRNIDYMRTCGLRK